MAVDGSLERFGTSDESGPERVGTFGTGSGGSVKAMDEVLSEGESP